MKNPGFCHIIQVSYKKNCVKSDFWALGACGLHKTAQKGISKMSMEKTRVAIVGYGGMGGWHARYLLRSDVCELAGVYDIDPAHCDLAREKGIFVYESLEALLADKSVRVVTVVVPNDVHKPIAVAAMEAGKAVVCEKPVAMNLGELEDMIATSKKTGCLFTVHQNRRWDKDFLAMKQVYASGQLGDVFAIESRVQGSHGIPGDWRGKKEHGGGMILDWGVHLIDQMLNIVYDRKVESLYCRCDHITNDEVDDGFKLDMYFEGGLVGRIEVGTSHFISLPRYYMTGTNGSAIVRDWKGNCHVVACKIRKDENVVPVVTAAGLTKTMAPRNEATVEETDFEGPEVDVHDFYRNVCLAIDGRAEQLVTHAQQIRLMKLMEACFASDAKGAPVAIDDEIC